MGYPVVAVGGGDFVPPEEDTLRAPIAEFLLEGLAAVGYEALGLGELELELGRAYLTRAAAALPLVCANLDSGIAGIPAYRRVPIGEGRWAAVTGYVDPLVYYEWPHAFDPGSLGLTDPREALTRVLEAVKGADFVVVLAHAPREAIEELAPQLPGVDVIVQGHDPEGPRQSRVGETTLMIPSARSRDVSLATFVFDAAGHLSRMEPHNWRLQAMERADSRLDAMLKTFMDAHGMKREAPPAKIRKS
jgi:2',3'-cyclic-nucleotide 2'-phosphodiesterase (5'-nucleotidase family)